jgi:mannose-1-phosphate guanylyltransferase
MIAVIIAGGRGTRLWPLSTSEYPKHLLELTNEGKSLLQNTYDRANLLADTIYIISEASHVEHVYKQLPDLPKIA